MPGNRRLVALAFVLVALVASGCHSTRSPGAAPKPGTTGTSAPAPGGLPTGAVKPLLRGVLDEDGLPSDLDRYGGAVIKVSWKAVQPAGPGDFNTAAIDAAVSTVRSYNATHPQHQIGLKLRLWINDADAPDWVKANAGTVDLARVRGEASRPLARFWTTQFAADNKQFVDKLSARYNPAPEIGDVTISQCSMFFMEPMIRWTNIPANNSAMLNAGYSLAADDACQKGAIDLFRTDFAQTHVSESFSEYQGLYAQAASPLIYKAITAAEVPRDAPTANFSQKYMDYCRATLATRCVLGNNEAGRSAVDPSLTPAQVVADPSLCLDPSPMEEVYAYQKGKTPLYYQSENPDPTAHGATAADLVCGQLISVRQGASYTELPVKGVQRYFPDALAGLTTWNSALTANASR
jgi:hypothetical protein